MTKIFQRSIYLEQIRPFVNKQLIKVLTGQRRVGKSYILLQLVQEIRKTENSANIIYINKEDLAFVAIKTGKDLNDYVLENSKNSNGKTYLFIDEIQDITDFEVGLRSLALLPDIDIYCTGSNANLLSGELATYLSGRYIEISIYSLCYTEFMEFHSLEESKETLEKYLKYGGLPYLMHLPFDENIMYEYIKSVYQTILYRDIIQRHSLRNSRFLESLVQFLANNIGSIFSAKRISDYLKSQGVNLAANQVQTYVKFLTDACIMSQVSRYNIVGKQIFESNEKYFFENLGIRNSVQGFKPQDLGKLLENAVYNHLCVNKFTIYVGTLQPEEIDFVAEKNGEKIYVQVALSLTEPQTIEREFGNLLKIKDQYPKMVVCYDGFAGNTYEGIKTYSIREFLLSKF